MFFNILSFINKKNRTKGLLIKRLKKKEVQWPLKIGMTIYLEIISDGFLAVPFNTGFIVRAAHATKYKQLVINIFLFFY